MRHSDFQCHPMVVVNTLLNKRCRKRGADGVSSKKARPPRNDLTAKWPSPSQCCLMESQWINGEVKRHGVLLDFKSALYLPRDWSNFGVEIAATDAMDTRLFWNSFYKERHTYREPFTKLTKSYALSKHQRLYHESNHVSYSSLAATLKPNL